MKKVGPAARIGGRAIFLCRWPILIVLVSAAASLNGAPPGFSLRHPPQEVIDPAAIDRFERLFENRTYPPAETIHFVSEEIGRYTAQFREKRHNDRRVLPVPERLADLNADLVRLLRVAERREPGGGFFFERSPYLKRLYLLLARAYEAQNEPVRALSAYVTGLRYGSFERPYDDPEQAPEKDRPRLREEVYQSILTGLADPDRLAQESDPGSRDGAGPFRQAFQRFQALRSETAEARRLVFVEEAKQLRGTGNPAAARGNLQRLVSELQQTEQTLEDFRKGLYRNYYERESRGDGKLLIRMARLSREIETRLRLQERVLNRSNYYRGTGNVFGEERTVLRDFTGYRALLELSNRLDPSNPESTILLAEEYRTGRETTRAIMYYERYIELLQQKDEPGLALAYVRLAGLYADRKNYIRAVQVYEELFRRNSPVLWEGVQEKLKATPPEPGLAEVLPLPDLFRLHLADLEFGKTGPLEAARKGYESSLAALEKATAALPPTANYRLRSILRKRTYEVMLRLAAIERRGEHPEAEKNWLARSVQLFRTVQSEGEESARQVEELRRTLADLSASIRKKEDEATSREYYRLNYAVRPELEARNEYFQHVLQTMDLPAVLERQAYLLVRERDFEGARPLYREIIARGRGDEATRARTNLDLLGQGGAAVLRRMVLPSDFER